MLLEQLNPSPSVLAWRVSAPHENSGDPNNILVTFPKNLGGAYGLCSYFLWLRESVWAVNNYICVPGILTSRLVASYHDSSSSIVAIMTEVGSEEIDPRCGYLCSSMNTRQSGK